MKKIFVFLVLFSSGLTAQQAAITASYFGNTIEGSTMKEHVYTLASDEFEGRETGTEGNMIAAKYIANQLASYGIPPLENKGDYYQEVAFTVFKWQEIDLSTSGQPAEHLKDYYAIPQRFPVVEEPIYINSMVFLGYGIDDPAYSDFEGVNVRGKHLLVYGGEPRIDEERFRISGTDKPSSWSYNSALKVKAAKKAGAASIWIIEERFGPMASYARRKLLNGSVQMVTPEQLKEYIPNVIISSTFGQKIAGEKVKKIIRLRDKITATGKSKHTKIPVDLKLTPKHLIESTPSVNVLGFIEGIDPELKNEIVILTAHFDHLGKRGNDIFNGADDNASGTSGILEIAQAFAIAKEKGAGPKRSVLCMLVTGEEKGLLGSEYYVENPVFPLENTVAEINIDMIGRADKLHPDSNYVYIIGANRLSTELHEINESANEQFTKLNLDYTYNEENDPNRYYYRSDHYNFAKNGIPSIFYFAGSHPDYHRHTDTPDKIMYDRAATIARLAFYTAWELANRADRIKVDVIGKS